MRTRDFDFQLPGELIAQTPSPFRDQSRLLVLTRNSAAIEHRQFVDLTSYVGPGDLLVLNDSKVIPARLRAINPQTGGKFEILLLEENSSNDWWAMLRPAKRARPGTKLLILGPQSDCSGISVLVLDKNEEGHRRLRFESEVDIFSRLESLGEVPLPPYILRSEREDQDRERYQTVFAQEPGSVAAPTAGLHFTQELLQSIRARGAAVSFVTLHVGPGTFAPLKVENLSAHRMHEERYHLSPETADQIQQTKRAGGRVIAVGTTTLRVLESCVRSLETNAVQAGTGRTNIFIYPPYRFKIVDSLVTNFHLPRSTLLMLVSAFVAPGEITGRELILKVYGEAIAQRYRFFSYGDAMLIR